MTILVQIDVKSIFRGGCFFKKKTLIFLPPPAPYPVRISTRSSDGNPGPSLVAEFLDLEHALYQFYMRNQGRCMSLYCFRCELVCLYCSTLLHYMCNVTFTLKINENVNI